MPHPKHLRARALALTKTVAVTCTATVAYPTSNAVDYFEGKAVSPSSIGKLMYIEAHWVYAESGDASRLVLYRCPDGTPFACEVSRDQGHPPMPDFALEVGRSDYQKGLRSEGGERITYVCIRTDAQECTAAIETSPMPVSDASFDAYIRSHWERVGGNRTNTMPFVMPSRPGTLSFKVEHMDDAQVRGREVHQYHDGAGQLDRHRTAAHQPGLRHGNARTAALQRHRHYPRQQRRQRQGQHRVRSG